MIKTDRKILWCVAATALAVRLAFGWSYAGSPFRNYHLVPGLDMQTMLRFAEWDNGEFPPLFVVHRFIVAAVRAFNGFEHAPLAVVAVQALLGVLGAVLTADIALRIWRRRCPALLAGGFYALYGPFLIYEFAVLQDAVVINLTLLGFWALVRARDRGYGPNELLTAGAALGLAAVGRPAALPLALGALVWVAVVCRRRFWRCWGGCAGGMLLVWGTALLFNGVLAGYWNAFFNVLPYSLEFNLPEAAAASPAAGGVPPADPGVWLTVLGRMAARIPRLFSVLELPENLNYYFLCREFPLLDWLPGPAVLLPAAASGLFWLLAAGRSRRRAWILLMPVVLLVLPLCVREPIGRYRLMLAPYLILLAAELPGDWLRRPVSWRRTAAGVLLVAAVFAGWRHWDPEPESYLRSSDFVAWGAALAAGGDAANAEKYYRYAWEAGGFTNTAAAERLIAMAYDRHDPEAMAAVVDEGMAAGRVPPSLLCYYGGIAQMGMGQWEAAERFFERVDENDIPELAGRFCFLRALTAQELGQLELAEAYLHRALEEGVPENLRLEAEKRLRELLR